MKKILFVLFIFCAAQLAAQSKSSLEKKLTKSDAETVDPKKGLEPKTWLNRGKLLVDIYELPVKSVMKGMSQLQIKAVLKDEKSRTDNVDIGVVSYEILRYPDKKLYFNEAGLLIFWEITEFITPNPLVKAYDAYNKAYELDEKKKETKKIREGLVTVSGKLINEAEASYSLERYSDALNYFETSLKCSGHPTVNIVDTLIIYNTGLTARKAGDNEKALAYYQRALEIGYEAEGNTQAGISELLRAKGDTTQANEILAKAVIKFPKNQALLVDLINAYMSEGSDLSKVLAYIKQAQENEPNNASLYNTEGVIYEEMGNKEKAIESYKKAIEVDPTYFVALYHIGALHYNEALKIQTAASEELDDTKYGEMIKQLDAELRAAIPYFEKALELEPNEPAFVEHLKSIYYRFREEPGMQEKYDYYTNILKEMTNN